MLSPCLRVIPVEESMQLCRLCSASFNCSVTDQNREMARVFQGLEWREREARKLKNVCKGVIIKLNLSQTRGGLMRSEVSSSIVVMGELNS